MAGRLSGLALIRTKMLGKLVLFSGAGCLGAALGDGLTELPILSDLIHGDEIMDAGLLAVVSGFWFGVIGAMTSFALALASVHYRRSSQAKMEGLLAMLGGFAVTMPIGMLAQYLYNSIGPTEVLRVLCWGVAGGLMGAAFSVRIPNLGFWRGCAGGLVGGMIGAVVFIFVASAMDDMFARLVGVPMIGLCLGAMLVIAEGLFRSIWLEITVRGKKTVVPLGASWLSIGSDPRRCAVVVPGPAIAERYRLSGRLIQREDMAKAASRPVSIGDSFNIGSTRLVVCGRAQPIVSRATR